MEYQALYRKYRPQRFSEVIGQEHVTATLGREVLDGKVAHAYLFAGPRGTGKTTTARILAKSLNCQDRLGDGEPCNACNVCAAITEGSSLDVIELDAASHNSVDDIREMRVSVSTVASTRGAKRVFILDEAHMLSKAAGNALLKTLEEPPEHVHFVLATTEPYKLLDTIRSRSQRFDFHPVGVETLRAHLERISKAEGYQTEAAALTSMARHARGSVRDVLSMLEQVAALGDGTVALSGVSRALGLPDREVYSKLAVALSAQDAAASLELVAGLAGQGVDLRRFVAEALAFFRGVFLAHYAPNLEEVADEPSDVLEDWRRTAKELEPGEVLRTVDGLGEALLQLREGREERLVVELALLKLARPEVAADPASLAARLERLEQRVRRSGTAPPPVAAAEPAVEARPPGDETFVEPVSSTQPAAPAESDAGDEADRGEARERPAPVEGLTLTELESVWPALLAAAREELGPRRWALFREVAPGGVRGSVIELHVPAHLDFHLAQLRSDRLVADVVEGRAAELLGGGVRVEFHPGDGESEGAEADAPAGAEKAPDKEALAEAPEGVNDPASLVEDLLGGTLVEEVAEGD